MAINSERLLKILAEAEAWQERAKLLERLLIDLIACPERVAEIDAELFILPNSPHDAILLEREHFRKNAKRNEYEKRRAAKKRNQKGGNNAPD